jgi:hypothetical protein
MLNNATRWLFSNVPVTLRRAAIRTSGDGVTVAVSAKANAYSMTVMPLSLGPVLISRFPQSASIK